MIAFGPWLPDQPEIFAPHLRQALNVIPQAAGYRPFRDFAVVTEALNGGACRGAAAFKDENNDVHVYAGTETTLEELLSDASWDDASGATYTTTITSTWRFAQFGDRALATNFDDVIQYKVMSAAGNYANLAGSPPRAKRICTFRDFVVLGYTDTSSAEIAWSAINNSEGWTAGTSQSDRQTLPDGGAVQGFAPGDVLLIFQQRKVRVMQYVGPPLIMQIDILEQESGCLEPNSICQHGRRVFYLAEDGFRMIVGLEPSVNVGEEKINDFFFNEVDRGKLYTMSSGIDPDRSIAYWAYTSQASGDGLPDTILIYYYGARPGQPQWSIARRDVDFVFNSLALGYTLEGLDAIAPSGIDLFPIPLDDPILQGGSLRFSGFNRDGEMGVFNGSTLQATIETGDFELIPGKRAYVSGFRPVTDADDITGSVAARERAMDNEAYTSNGTLEAHGMVSLEASGRYHRAMTIIGAADTWSIAQGLDFEYAKDGDL